MILGVPLGIVLYCIGARLLVQGGIDLAPRDRGRTTVQTFILGMGALVSAPPFILSLLHTGEPQVMLQCTFGAYISNIGLASFLLVLLLSDGLKGMRLVISVIALGTIFLTVIGFTGYLSFDESALLLLLMIMIIMVPYLADIWKTGLKGSDPATAAAVASGHPRSASAVMTVAGFIAMTTATAAGVLGLVYPVYEGYLVSQVVLAFMVGTIISVMQIAPAAIMARKGLGTPAAMMLVTSIFMNTLLAFLAVCILPLTEVRCGIDGPETRLIRRDTDGYACNIQQHIQ